MGLGRGSEKMCDCIFTKKLILGLFSSVVRVDSVRVPHAQKDTNFKQVILLMFNHRLRVLFSTRVNSSQFKKI